MTDRHVVVVGGGMVAQRLVELLAGREGMRVTVLSEEVHAPYDRVALSTYVDGASVEQLTLGREVYDTPGVTLHLGAQVTRIDRGPRVIELADGSSMTYDELVLATGSRPFVPPVPGHDSPGCFVYRTLADLDAIRTWCNGRSTGAVIGGGLLGLEAANALRLLGMTVSVIEFAPRLMPVQIDPEGGRALRRHIEALGLDIHTSAATQAIEHLGDVLQLTFADSDPLEVDVVVFSAGIRPRDELARGCDLEVAERGGVFVDETCRTVDPHIWAVGECAAVEGTCYGLVAPGYATAEVVASRLRGGTSVFTTPDLSTKLKLLGVGVASFGDAHATTPGALEVRVDDPVEGTYTKLVVAADGRRLLGGVMVGDVSTYPLLAPMVGRRLPQTPAALLASSAGNVTGLAVTDLPDEALVCSCNAVSKGTICSAVRGGTHDLAPLKACTRAGTGCGSCLPLVDTLRKSELCDLGVTVSRGVCEHFPEHTRQELYDLVRVHGYDRFAELIAQHGTGRGCEICRPAVASILASRTNSYVLSAHSAALQDTNDHALANLQKDGTYSVVPRVPGGEITPAGLIAIGAIAEDFGLYTKITGGQRIDLFGARMEQLPAIWRRLGAAGFESGHAYGKALRTVKSCVGSTWCRYGVQDSVGLAVALELRYRGLRAPHKIKGAVSGCARECAEAQGKDVGVIATEKGWNLYVAGNGGMRPQHAVLLAQDLDTDALVRAVDRFLLFYVSTADRLERTASWFNRLEGGVEHLRRVVFDDVLEMGAEWDAHMANLIGAYECEWAATLRDPIALQHFQSFVNAPDEHDPDVVFSTERGQPRPATEQERTVLLGSRIPVGVP